MDCGIFQRQTGELRTDSSSVTHRPAGQNSAPVLLCTIPSCSHLATINDMCEPAGSASGHTVQDCKGLPVVSINMSVCVKGREKQLVSVTSGPALMSRFYLEGLCSALLDLFLHQNSFYKKVL